MRRLAVALAVAAGAACHAPAATSPTEALAVAAGSIALGAAAPDGPVATADGTAIHLHDRFAGRTQTVLVFYRGFY